MQLICAKAGDNIDLPAGIAACFGISKQRRDVKLLDALDGLWNRGSKSLPAHTNILIIIIRAIDRVIISASTLAIDGKLPGAADAGADAWATRADSLRRRGNPRH